MIATGLAWLIWLGVVWLGAMLVTTLVALYFKIRDSRDGYDR